MKDKEDSTLIFLEKYHLDVRAYDFDENCRNFIDEMKSGLDSGSSLEMVPTFIEKGSTIPTGVPVLVLDAGGTNFRAAIVTFSEDRQPEITKFRKMGMPGIEREYTKIEFYKAIADFIEDLALLVDRIGFCFSYPMDKTSDKDGRLIKFSKEVKAPEVVGTLVGKSVLDTLRSRGINNVKKVIMLNDTVATLLAGRASGGADSYDEYIGLIIGTGMNASYNERNSNIKKISGLPEGGSQLINMECGSYSRAPFGDVDEVYRESTDNPLYFHFEKMISGAYLGPLCLKTMEIAASEELFTETFSSAVAAAAGKRDGFTTADLSRFLAGGLPRELGSAASEEDAEKALELCRALMERAAFLSAVELSAIILRTDRGKTAEKPVCICADGSTFWKLTGFREKIESYLTEYLESKGHFFKFIGIENAPVIGAAVAGLTN
jgi:hexokinase